MTPSDPAATLEAIKERAKAAAAMDIDVLAAFNGVSIGGVIAASAVDVPVLVAALEAVLKLHEPVQLYDAADGCGHAEPGEDTEEHDRWSCDHPFGTTGEQICLLSPAEVACDTCSEMVYGEAPTTDDYVPADRCHIRLAITREIAGKGGGSA